MKNEKGITLVALVITIIVLLILTGVSISLLFGNNGILSQSKKSVVMHRKGEAKDAVAMGWAAAETEYWNEWAKDSSKTKADVITAEKLQTYINDSAGGEVATVVLNSDGTYKVDYQPEGEDNKIFIVHDTGQIDSIDLTEEEKNALLEEILEYGDPSKNSSLIAYHQTTAWRRYSQVATLVEKVKYYNKVSGDTVSVNGKTTDAEIDAVYAALPTWSGYWYEITTSRGEPSTVIINDNPINPILQP